MGNCSMGCENDRLSELKHSCLGPKDSEHFETELRDSHAMLNHLLLRAAQEGALEAVEACLERGAFLETRRPFAVSPDGDYTVKTIDVGMTPLMYAAQNGYAGICKKLLEAKADVNAEDEDGLRPLHFAAMVASAEACEVLLRGGADPCARDVEDRAALDVVPAVERATRRQQEEWKRLFVVAAAAATPPEVARPGDVTQRRSRSRLADQTAEEEVAFVEIPGGDLTSPRRTHMQLLAPGTVVTGIIDSGQKREAAGEPDQGKPDKGKPDLFIAADQAREL